MTVLQNIELKINVEGMKKDLHDKQELLKKARYGSTDTYIYICLLLQLGSVELLC